MSTLQKRCIASFLLVAFVLYMDVYIFGSFMDFTKQYILSPSSLQQLNGTNEADTSNTNNTSNVTLTTSSTTTISQKHSIRRRLQQRQRFDTIASLHDASLQMLNAGRLDSLTPVAGTVEASIRKPGPFHTLPFAGSKYNHDRQQQTNDDYTNVFVVSSISSFTMVIAFCLLRILCCRGTKMTHHEQQQQQQHSKEPVQGCSCCCSRYISSSCFCWSDLEEVDETKSGMSYHKMIEDDSSERIDGTPFVVYSRGRKTERRSRSRSSSRSRSNSSIRRSQHAVLSGSLPLHMNGGNCVVIPMSDSSTSTASSIMAWMRTSTYSPFDKQSDRSRRRSNSVRRYLRKARESLYDLSPNRNNSGQSMLLSVSSEIKDNESTS